MTSVANWNSFLAALKERKIGQTTVVYLGTAWVLAEAFSFFSQRYHWPSFLFDQLIIVALLGLPAALVTRWYQSISRDNRRARLGIFYMGIAGLMIICCYFVFQTKDDGPAKSLVSNKSVAVLPFANLSKDPEQEYFSDGIVEDIISRLYKIADLQVTSRTSALMYKQTNKNIQQIAAELGVAYIVEGSVRTSRETVRVTARLIKAENDQNVWTETYDKPLQDIFILQTELSEKIANGLNATITASERERIKTIPTENTTAYKFYQQGRYYLSKPGKQNVMLSKNLFNRAIQEDSTFALAYVGLAEYYISLIDWGYASAHQLEDSIRYPVSKALALDNTLGEAYTSVGAYHLLFTHHFKEAEEAFEKAIQLNPGYDYTFYHYATLRCSQNKVQKAQELIARGIHLNPLSSRFLGYKIQFLLMARNYQQAQKEVQQVLALFPDDDFLIWTLACTQVQLNQYPQAVESFLKRQVPSRETNWALGYTYARMGEKEKARQILDFLIDKSKTAYVPPIFIGLLLIGLDEHDRAMDYIEQAYEQGDNWVVFLQAHPWFDPVRSTARFQVLLKKLMSEQDRVG